VGRLFPRGERAPAIVPVAQERLAAQLRARPEMAAWRAHASKRVAVGFYTSQGVCWVRAAAGANDLPERATGGGTA
jgi:magnesium-protoporphyrin O-methyltransferase